MSDQLNKSETQAATQAIINLRQREALDQEADRLGLELIEIISSPQYTGVGANQRVNEIKTRLDQITVEQAGLK